MKILKNEIITKILIILMMATALVLGTIRIDTANNSVIENETETNEIEENKISVSYNSHIQDIGWEKDFSKQDGELSGTSGKSLRLEAMKIKLNSSDISIKYKTHIQDIGWQSWKKDGELSGTSGQSKRLEAIRIQLENTEKYSVMYRVHIQDIGWQDWKYDGEIAGTEGKSLRLEAIEIKIVDKVKKGIINIDTSISNTYYNDETIKISGWKMANVSNTKIKVLVDDNEDIVKTDDIIYLARQDVINAIIGYGTIKENPTPGFSFKINSNDLDEGTHTLKLQLITENEEILKEYTKKIKIDKAPHVQYSTHIQDIGWQSWKKDSEMSGTSGKSLRLEGIKIKINNLPEGVTVKYQTHIQDIGWQSWKQNGEMSGTSGQSKRLEAIRIKLEGTEEYSIMYRTHIQDVGWQEWCYDGETSGTSGKALRLEGIEIKIVPKITDKKVTINIDKPTTSNIANTTQKIRGWIMSNVKDTTLQILIDDTEIDLTNLKRTAREDVLNAIKGYGDESINNKTPGFEIEVDFSKYELGKHTLIIRVNDETGVIKEIKKEITIREKITYSTGTYGKTGLKVKGDSRGTDLKYYKYGNGPNVFFATFAIHGYEDIWAKDGQELVTIANNFYQKLIEKSDYDIAEKWTIYIFPGVNQDGLNYGTTNNGPGRTTLYSQAPNNTGIDLNRCWQIGSEYTKYSDSRNYNGTTGFQAYEAQYLRDFLIANKSQDGQTILVDLHGWTQQVIGDSEICSYYSKQFPENDKSAVGRYGTGYLINWARASLGSTTKSARTALIELPNEGVTGHQSVIDKNFSNKYIQATLDMLKNI